jgi:hypothetical protein
MSEVSEKTSWVYSVDTANSRVPAGFLPEWEQICPGCEVDQWLIERDFVGHPEVRDCEECKALGGLPNEAGKKLLYFIRRHQDRYL